MSTERLYRVSYTTPTGGKHVSMPMTKDQLIEFIAEKGSAAISSIQRNWGARQKVSKIGLKKLFEEASN